MKKFFVVLTLTLSLFFVSDVFAQGVSFTTPTPDGGATTTSTNITVSATSTMSGQHYVLNNFDNSLVGWWRGEEITAEGTTTDESIFHNDGLLIMGATTTTGKFGQTFSFDGLDDYIEITSSSSLQITNNVTISAWVKPSAIGEGWKTIIANQWNWPLSGFLVSMDGGTGKIHVAVGDGDSFDSVNGTANIIDGNWHLVTVNFSSGVIKIYIDGELDKKYNTDGINSIAYSVNNLRIGKNSDGDFEYWSGLIDDILIFNRSLSIQEVRALYDASVTNRYINSDSSLKGWWTGDNTVNDELGVSNGTNFGVSYFAGKLASAFNFGGTGDYVEIPNQSYFSADDGALAISFWAMVPEDAPSVSNDIAGDAGAYIITKTGDEYGYEWGIENDGNTQICFDYWSAGNTYDCTSININDGLFHHYVAMFDDVEHILSLYIDGVRLINVTGASVAQSFDVPILVGTRLEKDASHSFTGSIDDVMIFNRILSNEEIQELYNQSDNSYRNTFLNLSLGEHTTQIYSADLTGSKDLSESRTFTIEAEPVVPPFANYGEEGIDGLSTSTAYTIANCQQLQNIATSSGIYLDKYFRLEPVGTTTVDCSETSEWNYFDGEGPSYYGFNPIGDDNVPFSGYFDGNNKDIYNLFIDRSNEYYVGLFGYASGSAIIKDLNLIDFDIKGNEYVGALVGQTDEGVLLDNISVTGVIDGDYGVGGIVGLLKGTASSSESNVEVNAQSRYAGGIAGILSGTEEKRGIVSSSNSLGTINVGDVGGGGLVGLSQTYTDITDSYSRSEVATGWKAGGLVGVAEGNIVDCYATGIVGSSAYGAGGLVGYLKAGTIRRSYATGNVSAGSNDFGLDTNSSYAGGLVGLVNNGLISASYATGNVTGESIRVGGLVGGTNSNIENSYATGDVTGTDRVGGLVGGSTGEIINSYSVGEVTANGVFILNEGDEMISNDGGGGGGGYFGGEGGQSDARPGAGGSGYFASSSVPNGVLTTGNNGVGPARALPPNTNDEDYITGTGLGGNSNSNSGNGLIHLNYGSGDVAFSYTGGSQTFIVPVGVTSINAKLWGAGGGGGDYSSTNQGGSGGYASGTITVTPLDTLVIVVGGGGGKGYKNIIGGVGGYGGGGYGTRGDASGGGGGGLSGIFTDVNGTSFESLTQDDAIIIAGGGGGGTGYYGPAGAGGGEVGNDGKIENNGGDGEEGENINDEKSCGGSQEAGGSCLVSGSDGTALHGGNGDLNGIKGTATLILDYEGGLIGYGTGTTTSSFWDTETSGKGESNGGTGETTTNMKNQSTFSGWDFIDLWIVKAQNYPCLQWQDSCEPNAEVEPEPVPHHHHSGSIVKKSTATSTATTSSTAITNTGMNSCQFVEMLININVINPNQAVQARSVVCGKSIISTTTVTNTIGTSTPYVFIRNLKLGMTGDDVKELQKILNTRGFVLASSGDGSVGFETTMFGTLTKEAVVKFQEANFDAILKPQNLTKGTGLFYDYTRAFVNNLLKQ